MLIRSIDQESLQFPIDDVVVQDELVDGMNFTHRVFSAKTTPVRLASVVCVRMVGIVDAF
jgi:hypothetical protein